MGSWICRRFRCLTLTRTGWGRECLGFLLSESSFVVLGVFWVLVPFTSLCCRVSVSSANAVPLTEERIKAIASTLGE